jgi:hypothetical protein
LGIYENAKERLSDFESTENSPVKMKVGDMEKEKDEDCGDKVGGSSPVDKQEFGEMNDEGKDGQYPKSGLKSK